MSSTPEDDLYGTDIWLGSKDGESDPTLEVTTAGDFRLISGREAVRQSFRNWAVTNPGEWKTKPTWGGGLRGLVKKPGRSSDLDQARNRLRRYSEEDTRVASVTDVKVEHTGSMVTFSVTLNLRGDDEPLVVKGSVE